MLAAYAGLCGSVVDLEPDLLAAVAELAPS